MGKGLLLDSHLKYYTYILRDPRDGVPRYVGMGTGDRAEKHMKNYAKEWRTNKRKCEWIQELKDLGLKYIIEKTFMSSVGEAVILEKELIARYGRLDYDENGVLLNHTPGGEGRIGGFRMPSQMRQRQSEAHFKLRDDPSYVHPSTGKRHSPESIAKMKVNRKSGFAKTKIYRIQKPDGVIEEHSERAISRFCLDNGLIPYDIFHNGGSGDYKVLEITRKETKRETYNRCGWIECKVHGRVSEVHKSLRCGICALARSQARQDTRIKYGVRHRRDGTTYVLKAANVWCLKHGVDRKQLWAGTDPDWEIIQLDRNVDRRKIKPN